MCKEEGALVRTATAWFILLILPRTLLAQAPPLLASPTFERDILPILNTHCIKCHGAEVKKNGLDLRTPAAMLRGGTNGPVLMKGQADKSPLFEQIAKKEMPPGKNSKLTDVQVTLIRDWINAGTKAEQADKAGDLVTAKDRLHWSFRPLVIPLPPPIRKTAKVRTAIDSFLLARLEENGLGFSKEAERLTLLRRASFDLVGLPPPPEEWETFRLDTRPDAYERLLDRLLASPHFGERWGRHWLDEAGYVDVLGTDNDAGIISLGENKWLYRDYVVRSYNEDKPFERFLMEQLAGDELVDWRSAPYFTPKIKQCLIATGFLRNSADDTDAYELNTPDIKHGILQRTGEVMVNNLLALSFNCAKCHDHKYEPIPQRDYYSMLAVLAPAFNPDNWAPPKQRALAEISPSQKAEIEGANAELERQVEARKKLAAQIRGRYEEQCLEKKLAAVPEAIRADVRVAHQTSPDKRTEVQKYLAGKFEVSLKFQPQEVDAILTAQDKAALGDLNRQMGELNAKRGSWSVFQAVYDVGPPTPTRLLRRGNHETPEEEVEPGFLSVLTPQPQPLSPKGRGEKSSGRRLALARWLTDWNSPAGALVAQVRVNRVWQHLFGKGIVETTDNFGFSGARPTHPQLLDWLAGEYVRNGGRLKPLLKLLMMSAAYRQTSEISLIPLAQKGKGEGASADPDNQLLGRMRLRRLEAEIVRDSLLAVGGKLNRAIGGPPIMTESMPNGMIVVKKQGMPTPTSHYRRSLYLLGRRNYHPPMLNVFDQPLLTSNCTCRSPSAVVLQSLTMLNDDLVLEQAEALADRVKQAAGEGPVEKQVEIAFRIVLSRNPTMKELAWCAALMNTQVPSNPKALVNLCHMLLNTNEFLYIG